MSRYQDDIATRLHTDAAGIVWHCRGFEPPQSSGKTVDTFALSATCSGKGSVFRVLGTASNAELLCTLFLRVTQREIRAVEVAGPNALIEPIAALQAPQIIMRMGGINVAASCGGWHEMTVADYNMYALIGRLSRNKSVFDGPAHIHFGSHPIAHWIAFIPTFSEADAAQVVAAIVDPRWFVDRRKPESLKNVFFYLGLTPGVQKAVSEKTTLLTRGRELRCARVLSAWKSATIPPEEIDLQNPANFLYRIWFAAGGGAKGDLRASQAFISYVVANWFDAAYRRPGQHDGLFAPELYFKTSVEQKAYYKHAEALAK